MVSQPFYTPSGRRYTCRPLPPYSSSGFSSATAITTNNSFYRASTQAADRARLPPSFPVLPPAFSSCYAMADHQNESDMPSSHRKRIAVAVSETCLRDLG